MRYQIISAVLASSAFLPQLAAAAEPEYSYVDAFYVTTYFDGVSPSADGFGLRGSVAVTDNVFVFAEYVDQDIEGISLQNYDVGVGYAWSLAPSTDLYARAAYVGVDASFEGFNVDDSGYGAGIGVRSFVSDHFELEGSLDYVELGDSGNDTVLGAAARWHFTDHVAAQLDMDFGDDTSAYGLGVRWNFR